MPRPRVGDYYRYMTSTDVCRKLGITEYQLNTRLTQGVFPPPTTGDTQGVRYFDEDWLRAPSRLLVRALLATGELELEDEVCPECGYIITFEEQYKKKIEKAERFLKQKFDPVDITREVTMPLVRWWLKAIESYMVEQGYRLPKWQRSPWLKEMEESTK